MNTNLKRVLRIILYPIVILRRLCLRIYCKYLQRHNLPLLAAFIYKRRFGKNLNYQNPQDLSEKINWMKFFSDTSKWTYLADKYLVRNYVNEKRLGHILVELYGVWDNPDDIDFDSLPQSFVLKSNHACGTVMLVKDKSKLIIPDVVRTLRQWISQRIGIETAEPHYLDIKPVIIAEEYLMTEKPLVDYKLFVVHGETELVMVCADREIGKGCNITLYDKDWNYCPNAIGACHVNDDAELQEKPEGYEDMKNYARILCKDFPFVRMDFYEVEGKVYFGEMTFTPKGGYCDTLTYEENLRIGKLITLPPPKKKRKLMQNANRIIVNTLAQYVRTILNMLLSLYSARLVLDILGAVDYGIYVLVAGVVSMLSFLTNSLTSSTQRFLSISQGKGDFEELKRLFANSLLLHIILGGVVLCILGSLGPFLFEGFLNIPKERTNTAMLIYQQVMLMVYISFISAPYRALLVSRENIVYTSIIDVVDGMLKVFLVVLLYYMPFDKLETYGWMIMGITVFNLMAFSIYCHFKYDECILPKLSYFNKTYLMAISKYTGWVTYSAWSIALRNQGLAIVLNRAMGTAVNAAYGIGTQICGMVSFISTSFTNAVSPQLTAAEGGGERERMWRLAAMGSKIPFLLLSMIGIPTMFEIQTLLEIWLIDVPNKTALFACTFITMSIIDQLTLGLGVANRAIGNIGWYIFITSTPKMFILPFGWYILNIGGDVFAVCMAMIMIELLCVLLRIPPLKKETGFSVMWFLKEVILRVLPPVIISVMICTTIVLTIFWPYRILITYPFSILVFLALSYICSLNDLEKNKIVSLLKL